MYRRLVCLILTSYSHSLFYGRPTLLSECLCYCTPFVKEHPRVIIGQNEGTIVCAELGSWFRCWYSAGRTWKISKRWPLRNRKQRLRFREASLSATAGRKEYSYSQATTCFCSKRFEQVLRQASHMLKIWILDLPFKCPLTGPARTFLTGPARTFEVLSHGYEAIAGCLKLQPFSCKPAIHIPESSYTPRGSQTVCLLVANLQVFLGRPLNLKCKSFLNHYF